MSRVLRWVVSNLPLMFMALLLAVLAWVVALEQSDPTTERVFPRSIPVSLTGLADDMLVVGSFDESVQVTLRTTQSVWDDLTVDDFEATADASELGPGAHELAVDVELDEELARILEVDPNTVTLELDARSSRVVPVRIDIQGEPAVGYVSRDATVEPRDVTVQGPTSYVTQVVEAFGSLSIRGVNQPIEEAVSVQPRDDEGNVVSEVALTPDSVDVHITIEPSGYHRALAVKAVLTGEVASGYRITDIGIEPPTITVFGSPADLALQEGFIETKPINVEGAQEDVVTRPGLRVPSEVTVVPGQEVTVRVAIEAIQSSLTITSTPQIQGLEPGYTYTLSPNVVQVILSGPLAKLEALGREDVRLVLELFELTEGTHQLEPEIIVPNSITPQSIIPATIQVRLTKQPTPTVSSGSPVTPTATVTTSATDE
ncbi:MAG: YbbR-like domain-containing protein [Chloroflexota bacterium]